MSVDPWVDRSGSRQKYVELMPDGLRIVSLGQKSTQPESLILAQSERWRQA